MSYLIAVHVVISIVALGYGFYALYGMVNGLPQGSAARLFLWTTVATNLSGIILPAEQILPAHILAGLSLIALALAIAALEQFRLEGGWKRIYVIGSLMALYFNCFVLMAQMFQKVPAMKEIAPTQGDLPFALVQGALFLAFIWLGRMALNRQAARKPQAMQRTASA